MNKKNFLVKIAFAAFVLLLLLSLLAPAIFPQRTELRPPRQETLLNGLKVIMLSDPRSDRVSLKLRINSGSAFDPQGKEGVMKLLADNIFPNQEARDLFAEDLGGSLSVDANYDYLQINATAKPDQFLTMLDSVANAISNISIDKDSTAKLKAAQLVRIQELEKDPAYIADQAVAKRLFGTFPYGRPVDGTAASISKIEFADLIDAKLRFLTADNATLAITGNFDSNLAFRGARRLFGGWLKADKKAPSTFRQPDAPEAIIQSVVAAGGGNKQLRYAVRGVAKSDPDYLASEILARIIEVRLSMANPAATDSMAAGQEIQTSVRNEAHILPGSLVIGLSGRTVAASTGKDSGPFANVLSRKLTPEEFQFAKSNVGTSLLATDPADFWLDVTTYKTQEPKNSAQAVTLADVQALADKIAKLPVASVIVERSAETNSVPK